MGVPRFDRPSIPACGSGDLINETIGDYAISAVNTGVPHAVIFVEDLDIDIDDAAPPIRHNTLFPEGANVNFVRAGSSLQVRTFERGGGGDLLLWNGSCGLSQYCPQAGAGRG